MVETVGLDDEPKAAAFVTFVRNNQNPETKLQLAWSLLHCVSESARTSIVSGFPPKPSQTDIVRSRQAEDRISLMSRDNQTISDYREEMFDQGIAPPPETRKVAEPLGTREDYKKDFGRNKNLSR